MFLSVVKRVSESVAVGNLFCLRDYIYIACVSRIRLIIRLVFPAPPIVS